MTKYWSDELGRYIEGESLSFTGPTAPYVLVDGSGWMQRYAPITGGQETGEYPSQTETRLGATVARRLCGCGRERTKKRSRCHACIWRTRKNKQRTVAA